MAPSAKNAQNFCADLARAAFRDRVNRKKVSFGDAGVPTIIMRFEKFQREALPLGQDSIWSRRTETRAPLLPGVKQPKPLKTAVFGRFSSVLHACHAPRGAGPAGLIRIDLPLTVRKLPAKNVSKNSSKSTLFQTFKFFTRNGHFSKKKIRIANFKHVYNLLPHKKTMT